MPNMSVYSNQNAWTTTCDKLFSEHSFSKCCKTFATSGICRRMYTYITISKYILNKYIWRFIKVFQRLHAGGTERLKSRLSWCWCHRRIEIRALWMLMPQNDVHCGPLHVDATERRMLELSWWWCNRRTFTASLLMLVLRKKWYYVSWCWCEAGTHITSLSMLVPRKGTHCVSLGAGTVQGFILCLSWCWCRGRTHITWLLTLLPVNNAHCVCLDTGATDLGLVRLSLWITRWNRWKMVGIEEIVIVKRNLLWTGVDS